VAFLKKEFNKPNFNQKVSLAVLLLITFGGFFMFYNAQLFSQNTAEIGVYNPWTTVESIMIWMSLIALLVIIVELQEIRKLLER